MRLSGASFISPQHLRQTIDDFDVRYDDFIVGYVSGRSQPWNEEEHHSNDNPKLVPFTQMVFSLFGRNESRPRHLEN
jgi:hypothetical protein